jgi:RNA polymerase-binding transcription factor DksA
LQRHFEEIDSALARLSAGTYGSCEAYGSPIGDERLEARPTTILCIRCAAPRRR